MDPAVVGFACSVAIFAALRYRFSTSSLGVWVSCSSWDSDIHIQQVVEKAKASQLKICEYLKHMGDTSLTFLDDPFLCQRNGRKQNV